MQQTEVGWRTYYLFNKAEVTGDMLRDAQARPTQSSKRPRRLVRVADLHPRGRRPLRGDHRRQHQAPLRHHPRQQGRVARPSSRRGSPAATRRSRSARATPSSQLEEARKLELVLRSGALPAPISPSNEQRIGPSLGTRRHRAGREGRHRGLDPRARVHGDLLPPRRRRRGHRRALQPAAPARGPRDASAPR